VAVWGLEV